MIVLCVPQGQIRAVAAQLVGAKNQAGASGLSRALIVSTVAGVTHHKLRQLLPGCPHIVRTVVELESLPATHGLAQVEMFEHGTRPSEAQLIEAGRHLALRKNALRILLTCETLFAATGLDPAQVHNFPVSHVPPFSPPPHNFLFSFLV